jgi:hypothetical protein
MNRVSTFSPLFMKIGEFFVFATSRSVSSWRSAVDAISVADASDV